MKTIMTRTTSHDSFSFSRRYFNWRKKIEDEQEEEEEEDDGSSLALQHSQSARLSRTPRKKLSVIAVSKLRSALALGRSRSQLSSSSSSSSNLGSKVVGTLFGHRRGHVHFAFQEDSKQAPAFLVELATPTSVLVKEMASGLVRIALECDKKVKSFKLLEEPIWRTYCNGKKCGYAMRRDCGEEEWKVLNAIGPISMGAGVLPGPGPGPDGAGEMMYMRAKFERVVGSKDSEAFYMMNPDANANANANGGPELSIYLLRV